MKKSFCVMLAAAWFCVMTALAADRPVVALVTDFGTANEAVGECHGTILSVDGEIAIVDLTHGVKPFDIAQGARILAKDKRFPKGTVFVAVIDPGVGTDRRSVAMRGRDGFYYVAPDNGLLGAVVRRRGVGEAVALDPRRINPDWKPGTFDGRDLYSLAGAKLAASGGDLTELGDSVEPETIRSLPEIAPVVDASNHSVSGRYERADEPYGNIWTNIAAEDLAAAGLKLGDRLSVVSGEKKWTVPWVTAFGEVPEGGELAYLNGEGRLAFAINMRNCVQKWGVVVGDEMVISLVPGDDSL